MKNNFDSTSFSKYSDTIVFYHYFEKDDCYIENFIHFLTFGYNHNHDYVIIVAGKYSIKFPELKNVKYLYVDNLNYDYGGYCEAINKFSLELNHEFYFFINSSVRGPFIPPYLKTHWSLIFKEKMVNNVGLVGTTINNLDQQSHEGLVYKSRHGNAVNLAHIQSMMYVMKKDVMRLLLKSGFYSGKDVLSKVDVIADYEIRLSRVVLEHGYDIECLLPEYNNIDYNTTQNDKNPTSANGDPSFANSYYGRNPHPYEVIFTKTNRNICTIEYLESLAWSAFCSYGVNFDIGQLNFVDDYLRKLRSKSQLKITKRQSELVLNPAEIVNFTKLLLEIYPQFSDQIEQLLPESKKKSIETGF